MKPIPQNIDELRTYYDKNILDFTKSLEFQKNWIRRIGWFRLIAFILIILFFVRGIKGNSIPDFALAFVFLVGFLILLKISLSFTTRKNHFQALVLLNTNEFRGINGDYAAFENGMEYSDSSHPYIFDMDVFGDRSVFQSVNRSFTEGGNTKLAYFFSKILQSAGDILKAQNAVKELKKNSVWRQDFQSYALQLKDEQLDMGIMAAWLNNARNLMSHDIYKLLAYIFPVLSLVILSLTIAGLIPYQVLMLLLIVGLLIVGSLLKKTQYFQNKVSDTLKVLKKYNSLLMQVENFEFKSDLLKEKREFLYFDQESASIVIGKLSKILDAFDSRSNVFVGIVLNAFLLWDIHCLMRFERWRQKYAKIIPIWLDVLSEFDAFSSLGSYAFNHPDFTFPEISENAKWDFVEMGHPLIPKSDRVDNDLLIHKKGEIIIVTGPNMAGKSTFLRAIGVNLILAHMGAPVCAEKFIFKPAFLFSSMRTTDSLQNNESYFFSELKRLKSLLDVIGQKKEVFFLLDEILKGTNSVDKTAGSEAVISRLVELQGTGLIATHDLALGELENKFKGTVLNKCFDSTIENNQLVFDYKLHEGLTKNMNASFLMKKMGIIEEGKA
ncbi:MAG: hypothetical protein QNK30_03245 [Bacteroidales bacterium]|nr:hypothetical protein [Bacteroidales bacterium]